MAEYEAENFLRVSKDIEVYVQSVVSSADIKVAIEGTADVVISSRNLSADEAKDLEEVSISLDGISVVVNPQNNVKELIEKELLAIYQGEIRNWKDVGGDNAPIVVVSREEGSGTRGAFEEITGLEIEKNGKKYTTVYSRAIITDGNGSIKQNIALKKNGIGYISVGSVDDSVKAVSIDGVLPTEKTIKSGLYLISRPFLLFAKGNPSPEAQTFVDFILSSEGQKLVREHDYITVN